MLNEPPGVSLGQDTERGKGGQRNTGEADQPQLLPGFTLRNSECPLKEGRLSTAGTGEPVKVLKQEREQAAAVLWVERYGSRVRARVHTHMHIFKTSEGGQSQLYEQQKGGKANRPETTRLLGPRALLSTNWHRPPTPAPASSSLSPPGNIEDSSHSHNRPLRPALFLPATLGALPKEPMSEVAGSC